MKDKVVFVDSLSPEDIAGLEGCYVQAPGYGYKIYIPRRDENGVPILPADWYEREPND